MDQNEPTKMSGSSKSHKIFMTNLTTKTNCKYDEGLYQSSSQTKFRATQKGLTELGSGESIEGVRLQLQNSDVGI